MATSIWRQEGTHGTKTSYRRDCSCNGADHPNGHDVCHADVTDFRSSTFAFVLSLQSPTTGLRNESFDGSDCLLCASSTVLAHDIYSNLRDRDGHLCCGGQDCKPVEAVVLPDGNYYLP